MIYDIDRTYDFRVLSAPPDDEFFLLAVDGPSGPAEVRLGKLLFQRSPSYICPGYLSCRVKYIDDRGLPVLTHAIAPYVFELYSDIFNKGGTFEAEVMSVPANPAEEPYMLRDRNGIFFRLNEPDGLLVKGQKVRCRITKLTPTFFKMERVDEGAKLPYYSPSFILDELGAGGAVKAFLLAVIRDSADLDSVRHEVEAKNPLWIFSLARTVFERIPNWLIAIKLNRHAALCLRLVGVLRDAVLYLLEGSGFLNAVSSEHRMVLRQQLTEMVESIEPVADTLRLIRRSAQDDFVESILDKLQHSGYLYHPKQQFGVLMLIFRLHPEKVGRYLNRIFESIFGRDLENWKREPFRSAFVEQFKIYVSEARKSIEALPVAESREQKQGVETIVTAIALQLILARDDADTTRSKALFYRYISLLRPLNAEALLSKSFLALLGADLGTGLNYGDLKEPMMMMTKATVMPGSDFMNRIATTHRYSASGVELTVSSRGISLAPAGRTDITERVIPDGVMPWLAPQIYLNGIKGLSGQRLRKLADHRQWWLDIETNLFDSVKQSVSHEPVVSAGRKAEIDDEVYIVIESVDDYFDNNPTFNCRISDSEFAEAVGILKRDQIVGYNLKQPSDRAYRNADGSKPGFLAKVADIRRDGSYVFSLRDEVDRYIDEIFNLEDEYIAIVAGVNERDYSGITDKGIGLFLVRDADGPQYRVGDIVRCRMLQTGKQGQLRAYITSRSDNPDDRFDKTDAFAKLMKGLAVDDSAPQSENEELLRDIDELLSPDEVRELIAILRFKAISESDLIKAYDYLRFARLMALLIADEQLAAGLKTHASLLTLHQYFASNSRIDAEKLDELEARVDGDPLLRMIFHRLQMVSWLGRDMFNAELYKTASDPASELEGSIARMVLSYNMLKSSEDDADSSIASEIKQQIMKRLNVNNETRRGKYYGSESKYLEFKTSIVYPATAPGAGMREDLQAQQFHILSRIAGMLNAKGGRLYLGVNDDGYEVGMHDDFKYFERHSVSVGNYNGKIKSIGNLQNYLENLIDNAFDKKISTNNIDVFIDDEAEKGVVYFEIKESLEPVFLDGRLFVRQSGQATYEYHGDDVDQFVNERRQMKAGLTHPANSAPAKDFTEEHVNETVELAPEKKVAVTADTVAPGSEILATSLWTPNVLHSYENGYAEPFGYIYFLDNDRLVFSSKDLYYDSGVDRCRRALVISEDMRDACLILAYADEYVLRIPLSEIYEKGENIEMEYNSSRKLMFAVICSKDDGLLCVGADSSGALWKRVTKVAGIDSAHLMSAPRRIHEAPINHTVLFDIVDGVSLPRFDDCLADKLANKRFGATLRVKEDSPACKTRIESLINDCHTAY